MKWRTMDEKPKITGFYDFLAKDNQGKIFKEELYFDMNYKNGNWEKYQNGCIAWLDPEIPDEFLKPKVVEKKPCPWCLKMNWQIRSFNAGFHVDLLKYYFYCTTAGCTTGPTMPTAAEAEAAIFERVK